MKFFPAEISYFVIDRARRRNVVQLLRLVALLGAIVLFYSVMFHFLMAREGHEHSLITGVYWTLTVMSTLGFGDITFHTDIGRLFSIVVLLTGMVFMLILLPFTFIQFFYAPWMEAQSAARAPRELPKETRGHVILTKLDPVANNLIQKLNRYRNSYVLLVSDLDETLRLHDQGFQVVMGNLDNPSTYRKLRVDQAALVAVTGADTENTNVAFTVRELSASVPIIAIANDRNAVDVMKLSGCNHVLQVADTLGHTMGRRVLGGDAMAQGIGGFDDLLIAEANVTDTPLVGRSIRDSGLREEIGINVVGFWERGTFRPPQADTVIDSESVLLLAGTAGQVEHYNRLYTVRSKGGVPVVILGGGRVGTAIARTLRERLIDYRIVEKDERHWSESEMEKLIIGNAADLNVLKRAGIMEANTVLISTHDDDTNVYLAIYCRRLRPDIRIISRATLERNVSTLHRARTDFVMSYASTGANMIFNRLKRGDIITVAEGLSLFRMPMPPLLAGSTIRESAVHPRTGCNVVALNSNGATIINPRPETQLPENAEIVLIGTFEAEDKFLREFGSG